MKITYVGHGCYLFNTPNLNLLVDPILTEKFQDGTCEVYPRRILDQSIISDINAVLITHSHPGHLEIPSLSMLPNNIQIFYNDDPTLDLVINEFGFTNTTKIRAGQKIEFGNEYILFTDNGSDFSEVGILINDDDGCCWHLADTQISESGLKRVINNSPQIDHLICNFPAYNHKFFSNFNLNFPITELERCMNVIIKIKPKLVSPNYAGMRYVGKNSWINRYMFPITSQQFINEIKNLIPTQKVVNLTPGNIIKIESHSPELEQHPSPYISCSTNDQKNKSIFDPILELPLITDPNPDDLSVMELKSRIQNFMKNDLFHWLQSEQNKFQSLISIYSQLGIKCRIFVVYPDKSEESWLIIMNEILEIIKEDDCSLSPANITFRIGASILDLWNRSEIPYFHAYYYSRQFGQVFSLGKSKDQNISVKPIETRNPVSLYLNSERETVYHKWIKKQVKKFKN